MNWDKNTSPVGWYFGSYLSRFIEIGAAQNDDPERKFRAWENTVLVQADSLESAYVKVERIGKAHGRIYRGGGAGGRVRGEDPGGTELLPGDENLDDGVEVAWTDHPARKLKTLRKWVKNRRDFRQ